MPVTPITSKAQFDSIVSSGRTVFIDFWATWCGPCKMISPVFERLSSSTPGVEFYKVDVDDQPEVSQECGIRAMPTFQVYRDGKRVNEMVGADATKLNLFVSGNAASTRA